MGLRSRHSKQSTQSSKWDSISALLVVFSIAVSHAHADGEKIAVFTKNQTNPYFSMLRMGAESAAKQMNARVTQYVPTRPDSIPDQMNQVEDVITKRPDAVVFVPVDFKAFGVGNQAGFTQRYLPAVVGGYTFNGQIFGVPHEVSQFAYWINTDMFKAAGLDASKIKVPLPTL